MKCIGCGSEITDRAWRFCLSCGTGTAQLRLPSRKELAARVVSPGASPGDCPIEVPLFNDGLRDLKVCLSKKEGPDWVALDGTHDIEIPPGEARAVRMSATPGDGADGQFSVLLQLKSCDAARSSRWTREAWREQLLDVPLLVQRQMGLFVEQEILIFSSRRPELMARELTLLNEGTVPTGIERVHAPSGFQVMIREGEELVPLADRLRKWSVPPQQDGLAGRASLIVEMSTDDFEGTCARLREQPDLVLHDSAQQEHRVRLSVVGGEGAKVVAPYIVSIDFGTENTSVFGRYPEDPESVEAIPILDARPENEWRVLSYIAYNLERPDDLPVAGHAAKEYAGNPVAFFEWDVWRDVKLWLRSDDPERRSEYAKVLRDFMSALRRDANKWLEELFDGTVPDGVKYVLTLPVLDGGERYQEQRSMMFEALLDTYSAEIREGRLRAEDFVFVQEPQAAAACFLLSPDPRVQLEGYRAGDLVLVIDSGAGTTDAALVLVTEVGDVNKFLILGTFGTRMQSDRARITSESASEAQDGFEPFYDNGETKPSPEHLQFCGRWVDQAVLYLMCRTAAGKSHESPTRDDVQDARELALHGAAEHTLSLDIWSEQAKISLDAAKAVKLPDVASFAPQLPGVPWEDYRAVQPDLRSRVILALDMIVAQVRDLLAGPSVISMLANYPPEQRSIRYVFAVGGNSCLPVVEGRLKQHYPERSVVSLKDGDLQLLRKTAVVRGGVWGYDAPAGNLVPCTITWGLCGDQEEPLIYENTALLGEWQRQRRVRVGDSKAAFDVSILVAGQPYRVGRVDLRGKGAHEISFSISADWRLSVNTRDADGNESPTLQYGLR